MSKHTPDIKCVGHLMPMLTPDTAKHTVKQVIKMLRVRKIKFDAIACRGLSSMLIAPIVAMRMNKSLLCVRKRTSDCHSSRMVEGDCGARRYIILDDFIDSGATITAIVKEIFEVNKDAQCVGFIAYKRLSSEWSWSSFEDQMDAAWWDHGQNPKDFFPREYRVHRAVSAKKAKKCTKEIKAPTPITMPKYVGPDNVSIDFEAGLLDTWKTKTPLLSSLVDRYLENPTSSVQTATGLRLSFPKTTPLLLTGIVE